MIGLPYRLQYSFYPKLDISTISNPLTSSQKSSVRSQNEYLDSFRWNEKIIHFIDTYNRVWIEKGRFKMLCRVVWLGHALIRQVRSPNIYILGHQKMSSSHGNWVIWTKTRMNCCAMFCRRKQQPTFLLISAPSHASYLQSYDHCFIMKVSILSHNYYEDS